jgi:hypothetical protein
LFSFGPLQGVKAGKSMVDRQAGPNHKTPVPVVGGTGIQANRFIFFFTYFILQCGWGSVNYPPHAWACLQGLSKAGRSVDGHHDHDPEATLPASVFGSVRVVVRAATLDYVNHTSEIFSTQFPNT